MFYIYIYIIYIHIKKNLVAAGDGDRGADLHGRDHLPPLRLLHEASRQNQGREEGGGQAQGATLDNPLVRIHCTIEMIWWTGLAP